MSAPTLSGLVPPPIEGDGDVFTGYRLASEATKAMVAFLEVSGYVLVHRDEMEKAA